MYLNGVSDSSFRDQIKSVSASCTAAVEVIGSTRCKFDCSSSGGTGKVAVGYSVDSTSSYCEFNTTGISPLTLSGVNNALVINGTTITQYGWVSGGNYRSGIQGTSGNNDFANLSVGGAAVLVTGGAINAASGNFTTLGASSTVTIQADIALPNATAGSYGIGLGSTGYLSHNTYGNLHLQDTGRPININGTSDGLFIVYFLNSGTVEAAITPAGAFVTISDESLKENPATLKYGLREIIQLLPKTYTRLGDDQKTVHMGLMAEHTYAIMPEATALITQENGDVHRGVIYDSISMGLVNSVKELNDEITNIKEIINGKK
jgi:hypothetical protein